MQSWADWNVILGLIPMSPTIHSISGNDPCAPKKIKINVNVYQQVLKYWQRYSRKDKEDKKRLLNKYEILQNDLLLLNDQLLYKAKKF